MFEEGDTLVCCLLDNVMFYALGVAYSKDELNVFTTEDGRDKRFFKVNKEVIKPVASGYESYVKE